MSLPHAFTTGGFAWLGIVPQLGQGRKQTHSLPVGFKSVCTRLCDRCLSNSTPKWMCDFVLRWKKGQKLVDNRGESRKAWEITRGKRSQSYRYPRDRSSGQTRKVGLVVVPVNHPSHAQPLWLVVARPGKGLEPWYLLTSETIRTSEDGWKVVLAYGRRWQIETAWRYSKSELAMESPRLWTWERREKLLLMATLVYAFLLSLLDPELSELRALVLRLWCHRTGKRSQDTPAPLYRLRSALSRLWQAYLPSPLTPSLSLG
jgi:hypothetical protein